MEITIESITGRRTQFSNANPLETVRGLKTRIWKTDGVPVAQQSLVYRSQALEDERTLKDYQIFDGAVVKLILITRAGPINRKVESIPQKRDFNSSAASVEFIRNSRLPGPSSGHQAQASESVPSSTRRYTRQQMRNVQIAAASYINKNTCFRFPGDLSNSDMEQQSSSLIDLTFTPERQVASARRADENLRTMQRMRELRRSIERLSLEKSQTHGQRQLQSQQLQQQQQKRNLDNDVSSSAMVEPLPTRCRRPTGGTGTATAPWATVSGGQATGTQRLRSTPQVSIQANERYSAARAAYAAEDTSAKESSAGETEIEDAACCHRFTASTSNSTSNKYSTATAGSSNAVKSRTLLPTHPHPPSAVRLQLLPPPGFKSKHQLYRTIRRSSCSDVDVESSAVWSSDADADVVFNDDRSRDELFTVDDWNLDNEDWCLMAARQDDVPKATTAVDSSDDYEDAQAVYERRLDEIAQSTQVDAEHSSSADDEVSAVANGAIGGLISRNGIGQDVSSDPSELSSGVVICELSMAMSNRRVKVKRKSYHTPRHTNKRLQGASGMATSKNGTLPVEADDQSPLESPVKCPGLFESGRTAPRTLHGAAYSREHHTGFASGAGGFVASSMAYRWHRGRPRSKQRLASTAGLGASTVDHSMMTNSVVSGQQLGVNSTTTGESSSDEHEGAGRRESQGTTIGSSSNAAASSSVNGGRLLSHGHKPPQSSQSQQRCNACACRLSVATTFQCRCGKTVCLRHRHADLHGCTLLAATTVAEKK